MSDRPVPETGNAAQFELFKMLVLEGRSPQEAIERCEELAETQATFYRDLAGTLRRAVEDLTGVREVGEAPDRLGRLEEDVAFLARYLRLREAGHATSSETAYMAELAERTERWSEARLDRKDDACDKGQGTD